MDSIQTRTFEFQLVLLNFQLVFLSFQLGTRNLELVFYHITRITSNHLCQMSQLGTNQRDFQVDRSILLKPIYFHFETPTKQMLVFF